MSNSGNVDAYHVCSGPRCARESTNRSSYCDTVSSVLPASARIARVEGKVELLVTISPDGTVQSSTVRSGPPMLRQAATDSVMHSTFECIPCKDSSKQFRITYSFVIGEVITCTEEAPAGQVTARATIVYPQVTQSPGLVTIVDQAFGTCDFAATVGRIRVRSIKCLYLWRCGRR